MAATLDRAIRILQDRAADNSALAETVLFLAGDADSQDDPFADVSDPVLTAARSLNERRLAYRAGLRHADALGTAEVIDLIDSINDRRGVDRRRQRGQLLGWRSGRNSLHPMWQFDTSSGRTWDGLSDVLAALRGVCPDARAADELMTANRPDLDGHSLADLLAMGKPATAIRLILASTDQS